MQQHQGNNIMDMAKSHMMTMLMMKSMDNNNINNNNNSIFNAVYMLIITQFVDFVIKYIPLIATFFYKKYINFDKIQSNLETITNNTGNVCKVISSITITLKVTDPDNALGQAVLDYITNSNNTTHVSYKNKNFVLNQKNVIELNDGLFAIMRANMDLSEDINSTNTTTNKNDQVQVLEVYSTKMSMVQLREHLEEIKNKYIMAQKNKLGNAKYYFNMTPKMAGRMLPKRAAAEKEPIEYVKDYSRMPPIMSFSMKKFFTNRKFTNLFGEDIEIIKNRVKFFCNNKSWYDEKGIPYTLGLLLSGEPGTGKTSTIKCLANETGRHIFNINLNNDITKAQMENLFFDEMIHLENGQSLCIPLDQRIYVLEDIDCQSDIVKKRSNEDTSENTQSIDLSFLLNLLDGVLELPGRIVIMTSNHPDMLDHALVRPGRIDVIAKFSYCSYNTIIQMLEFFYDTKLTQDIIDIIKTTDECKITPAEMSRIMFENFADKDGAIKKYLVYVKKSYDNNAKEPPVPLAEASSRETKFPLTEETITITNAEVVQPNLTVIETIMSNENIINKHLSPADREKRKENIAYTHKDANIMEFEFKKLGTTVEDYKRNMKAIEASNSLNSYSFGNNTYASF